jgi:hypothetical protein
VIDKLLSIEPDFDEKGIIMPKVLDMSAEAYQLFCPNGKTPLLSKSI